MRLFTFFFGLLLIPYLSRAQFNTFEKGGYILAITPTVLQKGEIKFRRPDELVVRDANNMKVRYSPKEVTGFRLGDDIYIGVDQFTVGAGLGSYDVKQAFALQLEGGEVELLYYEQGNAGYTAYSTASAAYLLRSKRVAAIAAIRKGSFSEGKRFREAVRPFLAVRPDIVKCLDEKRIDLDNLPEAIHALNHSLPFNPPAALNID